MELPKSQLLNPQGFRIGHAAKRIRDGKGLSIEFVAGEIGLDAESYVQIEADQSVVNDELLIQLSKVLDISVNKSTSSLYNKRQSAFDDVILRIQKVLHRLSRQQIPIQ